VSTTTRAEFRSNGESRGEEETFDLLIDGRAGEYDLREVEFDAALRRRRVPADAEVVKIDADGRTTPYARRR
jgi:hypothetical protein